MSLKADYSRHLSLAMISQFRIRQEHTGIIRIYLPSTAMVLGGPPNLLVSVNFLRPITSFRGPLVIYGMFAHFDEMTLSC